MLDLSALKALVQLNKQKMDQDSQAALSQPIASSQAPKLPALKTTNNNKNLDTLAATAVKDPSAAYDMLYQSGSSQMNDVLGSLGIQGTQNAQPAQTSKDDSDLGSL